jgi:hypothetical protein
MRGGYTQGLPPRISPQFVGKTDCQNTSHEKNSSHQRFPVLREAQVANRRVGHDLREIFAPSALLQAGTCSGCRSDRDLLEPWRSLARGQSYVNRRAVHIRAQRRSVAVPDLQVSILYSASWQRRGSCAGIRHSHERVKTFVFNSTVGACIATHGAPLTKKAGASLRILMIKNTAALDHRFEFFLAPKARLEESH